MPYLFRYLQESITQMAVTTIAKMPTKAKSSVRGAYPSLNIISLLTASIVYDMGLEYAMGLSQLGIRFIGKYALLANIRGKVTKLKIACGVSILVALKQIAVNNEDNPKPMRNTIANTPNMLNAVKFAPN